MTNSAQQLHALLKDWQPGGENQSLFKRRGGTPEGNQEFWRRHGRAVSLLADVESLLAGLGAIGVDIETFERYLPSWYRAVFAPRVDWAAKGNQPVINQPDLDQLSSLAVVLDVHKLDEEIDPKTLVDLIAALDDAEQIVRDIDELPDAERVYVLGLIAEARRAAADVESFGTAGIRRMSVELGGAMMVTATRVQQVSVRDRIVDVARRLLFAFGRRAANRAIDAGVDEVLGQIGGS